jgi:hypothetical protein
MRFPTLFAEVFSDREIVASAIRMVAGSGIITTIAGTGLGGISGDSIRSAPRPSTFARWARR